MSTSAERPTSRGMLLVTAAALLVVGSLGSIGDYACYPFTLLATWVHETGHGLTAIAVGGSFQRLLIHSDASGLAYTTHGDGWPDAAVCLGGLLAPPILGTTLLLLSRGPRRARLALALLAAGIVLTTVLWVRTTVGVVVMPALALVILALVGWGSGRERMFVGQLIALRLALDTLTRGLSYLFTDNAAVGGTQRVSDIAAVAKALGGPRLVYSVGVAALSILLVALGLWLAWRRGATSGRQSA